MVDESERFTQENVVKTVQSEYHKRMDVDDTHYYGIDFKMPTLKRLSEGQTV